jgi:lipopolysaccharide exporter
LTTVELVLTWFFIIWFGLMGAVYATLTTCIIFFIVMQTILARQLKINFLNTFRYAAQFYPEFYRKYIRPRIGKKVQRTL